jgi:hypothetical protein
MDRLADALDNAANAYRNVAKNELSNGTARAYGGSIDKIYDCVRNSRNLSNKARKVRQFNSTF